jgi:mannose-6-phosphate isomerase
MFLPSGRVHALGGGTVIFEVQQNSDTTYRVFDWNRRDPATGQPRELHIEKSLASIDFEDFEPGLLSRNTRAEDGYSVRTLVKNDLFEVELLELNQESSAVFVLHQARIFNVVEGAVRIESHQGVWGAAAGSTCLVPAGCGPVKLTATGQARVLKTVPGNG